MGIATLVCEGGQPCIKVANIDGVKIAGLLLQAGKTHTSTLLEWGRAGTKYEGKASNPGIMSDLFARVGGPDQFTVSAQHMVTINSGHVIIDNAWLWRGDHSVRGLVKNNDNFVETGIEVNGDDIISYGLAVEHTLGDMTVWNGERGKVYFYQSEYPYDVTQDYASKGHVGYRVSSHVENHEAWGVGVYSFFRDFDVRMFTGIGAPNKPGVKFHSSLTRFLNGKGAIQHVINNLGDETRGGKDLNYVCNFNTNGITNSVEPPAPHAPTRRAPATSEPDIDSDDAQ